MQLGGDPYWLFWVNNKVLSKSCTSRRKETFRIDPSRNAIGLGEHTNYNSAWKTEVGSWLLLVRRENY